VKLSDFSPFLQFSIKLAGSERVLKAVATLVSAEDSVDSCDSKTAHKRALFSCSGLAGGCGELAVNLSVGGFKTSSLRVSELV